MNNQPRELRDFLKESEALVAEWYSRDGLEPSHEANLRQIATLYCLNMIVSSQATFDDLIEAGLCYLVAAFQLGRAAGRNDRRGDGNN